jgi:hypothetical protein
MDRSTSTHQTRGRSLWFAAGLAALLFFTAVPPASAGPRVSIGIGIGIPYPPPVVYYPPPPVVYYPPPPVVYYPPVAYGYPAYGGPVGYARPPHGRGWARGHKKWARDPWGHKVRVR